MSALASAALFLLLAQDPEPYTHETPGFELVLPTAEWVATDAGGEGVFALVFSPVANQATRCCVLRYPGSLLPGGLDTREAQLRAIAGDRYERVSLEADRIAGREARLLVYRMGASRVMEWCFQDEGDRVLLQLAAPEDDWADEAKRSELEALRDSFVWTGGRMRGAFDDSTPAQIRALRGFALSINNARNFEVTRHRIDARFEPEEHSLHVLDRLDLVSHADELDKVWLSTSVVEVVDVRSDVPLEWRVRAMPDSDALLITFDPPLAEGAEVELEVELESADYYLGSDQELVREIGVMGQVRPRSSWSSHVYWYPVDNVNDAAIELCLDVPEGLVGITGGEFVEHTRSEGRSRWRYREDRRAACMLPFGFAVADYEQTTAVSEAGLALSAWGFPGEEERCAQRTAVLAEAAALFERCFGPLNWSDVRLVHVVPEEKEMGVSLPGMILVSDDFFGDLEAIDASSGNILDPSVTRFLITVDELAHQWNFYSTGFPNELAEGLSTFMNALYLEERYGEQAYLEAIAGCRDAWIDAADEQTEYAIASPAVYTNTRYRSVVFCKTPVVLDGLRRQLGDELFFAGMRAAFAQTDRAVDGFERFESGFELATELDLSAFFEQWFFRAGFPELQLGHEPIEGGVRLVVRQLQAEAPYVLEVELLVDCADGSTVRAEVALSQREHELELALPAAPVDVRWGLDGRLPARMVPAAGD